VCVCACICVCGDSCTHHLINDVGPALDISRHIYIDLIVRNSATLASTMLGYVLASIYTHMLPVPH